MLVVEAASEAIFHAIIMPSFPQAAQPLQEKGALLKILIYRCNSLFFNPIHIVPLIFSSKTKNSMDFLKFMA